MISERYCEHGSYRQFCWRCQPGLEELMRQNRLKSLDKQATTPEQQVGWDNPLSHYLYLLADVTRGASMVRSLYVQIGVLRYQSWTIASAIGDRQTNVSLTLAIPHGHWFQMHRYKKDLLKSQYQAEDMGTSWSRAPMIFPAPRERRWWDFLTRG